MKIRTKFYLSSIVSVGLVVALIVAIFLSSQTIARENKKRHEAKQTLLAVSELNIVLGDYLLHHEKRAERQWQQRYTSLTHILQTLEEEGTLVASLRSDYTKIGNLFQEVATNYDKQKNAIGASQEEISIVSELESRLVTQLLVTSQSMIGQANQILENKLANLLKAQAFARNSALFMALTLLMVSLATALVVVRGISASLHKLYVGTEKIAAGNLDYKIGVQTEDEIGQVSNAFDVMTAKLKARTEELQISNQQLQASSQQLDASNQQLDAATQQLKASNQQLSASNQQFRASNQQLNAANQQLGAAQQQLQNKVIELEKFNKLTVGRELKMAELKQEITALRQAQGKN